MKSPYEAIAIAIRTNTLRNRFSTTEVVDKRGLVTTLSDHFRTTDTLFNADDFAEACKSVEELEKQ